MPCQNAAMVFRSRVQLYITRQPCFDDGGSRVQNALHLPQGRDDKKITSDNSRHRVSWDKTVDTVRGAWVVGDKQVDGGGHLKGGKKGENNE